LVTSLPLSNYFTSPELYSYFGSLVGRVQFDLPGVFLTNPIPNVVNGNLWTVPPEILCYLWMAAMITVAMSSERIPVTLCAAAVIALNLAQDSREHWSLLEGNMPGRDLVECFAFGAAFYMWRDLLPYRPWLFAAAAVVALALLPLPGWQHIAIAALAYCTAFLGCTPLPRGRLFSGGDYSYGIYLFGRPIQQTIVAMFPAGRNVLVNFPVSLALTIVVAMLSWRLIEKRALALRKHIASSDTTLRRFYLTRFAVFIALLGYAVALARVSGIFGGELSVAKLGAVTIGVIALAAVGAALPAAVPLLHQEVRRHPV
jgi:peptidoglycan/LPS O-acetylase OafA/YrhL